MAERITPTQLWRLAEIASNETGLDVWVNNAPHYGGWVVTINKGSTIIMQRDTPKACKAFLNGISFGIYSQLKKAAA
jgi:hypothetical protein